MAEKPPRARRKAALLEVVIPTRLERGEFDQVCKLAEDFGVKPATWVRIQIRKGLERAASKPRSKRV
jgi:hypothetical protein